MFIINEETGDIITRQGDTFKLNITGISDDWHAFFSVYRSSDREILFELDANPSNNETNFYIDAYHSNLMIVPSGKKTETYCYGIKRCKEVDGFMIEDTVIVGNKNVSDTNKITVYPLITEGTENGEG